MSVLAIECVENGAALSMQSEEECQELTEREARGLVLWGLKEIEGERGSEGLSLFSLWGMCSAENMKKIFYV